MESCVSMKKKIKGTGFLKAIDQDIVSTTGKWIMPRKIVYAFNKWNLKRNYQNFSFMPVYV